MTNRTAIYCRLSREDEKRGMSTSILNQQEFLLEYVKKHRFNLYKIYIDDGYSGGNFNRPSFKEMIDDILLNKIDIVLVKDLSRLGRNYLEVGYYTEEFFPSNNVRFIAVNDNYDSSNGEDDLTPFKNIINQWYLKDISTKVKAVHETRMKKGILPQGDFIPLFGYQYNELNERVIDPVSSRVVKKVFELYNQGLTIKKIKEELIKLQMTTPSYYNYQKYNYNSEYWLQADINKKYDWTSQAINRIITNQEYTGSLELKKRQTISYKTHQRKLSKANEKYIFLNRFSPIISMDTWQKSILVRKSKVHSSKYEDNVFHNLVYCDSCGKALSFIKVNNNLYLGCRRKGCPYKVRININKLSSIIKKEVKQYYNYYIEATDLKKVFENYIVFKNTQDNKILSRINKIEELLYKLHLEYLEGNISSEVFKKIKDNYLQELEQNKDCFNKNKALSDFELFDDFVHNELGINQLIKIMIDKIIINQDNKSKKIKVYFRKVS